MTALRSGLVWFTWIGSAVVIPIETFLSFRREPIPFSGYAVNVCGVAITVWALLSLRRRRPYAEGLLAAGWAWTAAVFWRATNLRYDIARDGGALDFGSLELWLAPFFTVMTVVATVGAIVVLVNRERD